MRALYPQIGAQTLTPTLEPELVPARPWGSRSTAPPHEAGSRQIQQPDRFRTQGRASWSPQPATVPPAPTPLDCGGLWLCASDPCGPLPSSTAPSITGVRGAVALCKRPAAARSLTPMATPIMNSLFLQSFIQ